MLLMKESIGKQKNYDQLEEHWENFYIAMDRTIQENSSLQGPFKLKSGRIIDLM